MTTSETLHDLGSEDKANDGGGVCVCVCVCVCLRRRKQNEKVSELAAVSPTIL